jgi:endonuclease/exonuclease/phosphatase family metal-dependent hydrolase
MTNLIRIGTYNTNNLFDRFDDPYNFRDDPWTAYREGTRPKNLTHLFQLGGRIRSSDVDVLGLQEIESYGALYNFVQGHVGPGYKVQDGVLSVPGNDPRGIDLGLLSKFPVGRVISHRFRKGERHRVFSRDCLEVEILTEERDAVLLTVFISHLKSKYSRFDPDEQPVEYAMDQLKSQERRAHQVAETIDIVKASQDIEADRFVILGDMNDTHGSRALSGFLADDNPLGLTNVSLSIPEDDDYPQSEFPDSRTKRKRDTHKWTRRDAFGDTLTTYSQLDFVLLSKALATGFTGNTKVEQRGFTSGSDHYMLWAEVDLDNLGTD